MQAAGKQSEKDKRTMLEKLYTAYRHVMLRVALGVLQEQGLAEDAVHTAFLRLSRYRFQFESIPSPKAKAFMIIVTRNCAIDIYHKRSNEASLPEDTAEEAETPTPLDQVVWKEAVENVQKALSGMQRAYSDVILLRYYYECTDGEIAGIMGISEQLVRVRLHRARKMLACRMAGEEAAHEPA